MSYYLKVVDLNPKPKYFEDEFSFSEDRPFLEEEERIEIADAQTNVLNNIVQDLEKLRDTGIDQESTIILDVQEKVDQFFAQIEGLPIDDNDDFLKKMENNIEANSAKRKT